MAASRWTRSTSRAPRRIATGRCAAAPRPTCVFALDGEGISGLMRSAGPQTGQDAEASIHLGRVDLRCSRKAHSQHVSGLSNTLVVPLSISCSDARGLPEHCEYRRRPGLRRHHRRSWSYVALPMPQWLLSLTLSTAAHVRRRVLVHSSAIDLLHRTFGAPPKVRIATPSRPRLISLAAFSRSPSIPRSAITSLGRHVCRHLLSTVAERALQPR